MREGNQQTGNIDQLSNGYIRLASGTTAQRPASPINGMLRYNTDIANFECYASNMWSPINFTFQRDRAPTNTDDQSQGYGVGAMWLWDQRVYICTTSTSGSAAWTELSPYPTHPGLVTNRYYGSYADGNKLTTGQFTTGTLEAIPIFLSTGLNFNRIGIEVTTRSLISGAVARLGLYNNGPDGNPGTLAADLGTVSTTSTGAKEIAVNVNVSGTQFFWLAFTTNQTISVRATASTTGSFILGRTSTSGTGVNSVTANFTYGALPSTFPANPTGDTSNPPFIWFRKV